MPYTNLFYFSVPRSHFCFSSTFLVSIFGISQLQLVENFILLAHAQYFCGCENIILINVLFLWFYARRSGLIASEAARVVWRVSLAHSWPICRDSTTVFPWTSPAITPLLKLEHIFRIHIVCEFQNVTYHQLQKPKQSYSFEVEVAGIEIHIVRGYFWNLLFKAKFDIQKGPVCHSRSLVG